jgi:hypothetical protein
VTVNVTIRALRADEVESVQWALYDVVSWSPERELLPFEVTTRAP